MKRLSFPATRLPRPPRPANAGWLRAHHLADAGRLRALVAAISIAGLAACQSSPLPPRAGPLRVVATFSILGDFAQNVGGDRIQLATLVGPDGDAHTFEPSPVDSIAVAEADLVIENGFAFETWMDDFYAASGSRAKRAQATAAVAPLMIPTGGQPGELDPHVWLDAQNAMRMVETIRDALSQLDPDNAAAYAANAERYLAELQTLDDWIVAQVETLPPERRKLVTSHDTLGYFARRYGFELVGDAFGSVSTESADPSAAQIADLLDKIHASGAPAIFAENVYNPGLMERLAADAGVTLAPPLYTDALGHPGGGGETYLKMMRYNVTTIVTALAP